MFTWRGKPETQAGIPEERWPQLRRMREDDVAVVFKHSPTCPVSWHAEKQVKKFAAQNPAISVYTVVVQKDRELARAIAEFTGVRHESPQVIVMRRGIPVANASHQDVSADFLNHWVGSK